MFFMCVPQILWPRIDDVIVGPDCVCSAATEAVKEAVQASNGTEAAGQREFDLAESIIAMGIYEQVKLHLRGQCLEIENA